MNQHGLWVYWLMSLSRKNASIRVKTTHTSSKEDSGCRCLLEWRALQSYTAVKQRYTLQSQRARWFSRASPPAMNTRRGGNTIRHTGLLLERNAWLSHARWATLLRSMVRHTLGGDHDHGTYVVPQALGWCGLYTTLLFLHTSFSHYY